MIYKEGTYEITNFDLTNHYVSNEVLLVKKFDTKMPVTALYYDGLQKQHFIKRFNIETSSLDKKFLFISDAKNSKLLLASTDLHPRLEISLPKTSQSDRVSTEYLVEDLVDIRGWKAIGNKLPYDKFKEIRWLEPLPDKPEETPVEMNEPEINVENDEEETNETIVSEEKEDEIILEEPAVPEVVTEEIIPASEDESSADKSEESKGKRGKKEPKKGSDPKSQLGIFE